MSSSRPELRPLTLADAPAVAELERELEADVGYRVATTAADVEEWWTAHDLARDSWGLVEDGSLVAAAWLFPRDGVAYQGGIVRPSARGRGHGSTLVERCEARARALGLPHRPSVLGADHAAAKLLARRGYTVLHRYRELALELAEPPEPIVPPGIRLEPFRLEDARVFHGTIAAAFADNWDFVSMPFEQWYELRVAGGDMSFCFLAWDGGEAAGAIRCDRERRGLGWVGALGVLPGWRGRGIGRALLLRAFRAFWESGRRHVGLGVDAGNASAVRLYEGVGMRTEAEDVVYERASS